MKYSIFILLAIFLTACREEPKQQEADNLNTEVDTENILDYPEALEKVFEAHGGLKSWKSYKSLVYEIPKEDYSEVHSINLYSRKDRVDTPDYSMGFDGEEVWLRDVDSTYTGDPVFYHNLMFYFYAMPFVLADQGIVYTETEDLQFEDKSYPGIGIGYQQDIGTSPKDEYFMHYDPETMKMAWLGYTVTYRTGEKSENIKWIRYDQWQDIEGVILPSAITWYDYEGRVLKSPKSTVEFQNVVLSEEPISADSFERPEGGIFVQPTVPGE